MCTENIIFSINSSYTSNPQAGGCAGRGKKEHGQKVPTATALKVRSFNFISSCLQEIANICRLVFWRISLARYFPEFNLNDLRETRHGISQGLSSLFENQFTATEKSVKNRKSVCLKNLRLFFFFTVIVRMREQRNASASFSRNIISKIKNYLLKIEEKRINR